MKPARRKVWLPWLLLLVPTLLIGAVALRLLWQEQRRIDEAEADARTRASLATRDRAQIAADNIELLVAEIRDGLMRELAETPAENLDALLANWPRTNPLVAQTFLWRPNGGGLAWPPADTVDHVAFRARHAEIFRGGVAQLAARSQTEDRSVPVVFAEKKAAEPAPAVPAPARQETAGDNKEERVVVAEDARSENAGTDRAAPSVSVDPVAEKSADSPPASTPAPDEAAEWTLIEGSQAVGMSGNFQVAQNRTLRRDVQQQTKASAERARNFVPPARGKDGEAPARYAKTTAGAVGKTAVSQPAEAASQPYANLWTPVISEEEKKRTEAEVKLQAERQQEVRVAVAEAVQRAAETEEESVRFRRESERIAAVAAAAEARLAAPAREQSEPVGVPQPEAGMSPVLAEPELGGSRPLAPWVEPVSGWLGRTVGRETFFLGWWQPAGGGAVRGVELNLPAVLERVQALVPARTADGEHFAVRGPGQATGDAAVRIPLATTLPGWTLVAWPGSPGRVDSLDAGGGFFVVAALLVGVFVVSILAGGAMFFRQAADAAREAALKTSFVSNVSHEMKTPLTTIRMYAEMLADERVDDPAKRARYFATIGRETARLTRLVNNALDFGRLEAGRKEYRPEPVALGPWLARLVETYAPRAAEIGVRLVATPPATGATVRCDPDSLDQMALNLIDNALKYGAAGGLVELHADAVLGGWAVVVADRGPGVPAAHRERIFDRFHRVDESLTAKTQGAGLGLTIARRLARDQGGDLVCRERTDGGAAFVLTLPGANNGISPKETK